MTVELTAPAPARTRPRPAGWRRVAGWRSTSRWRRGLWRAVVAVLGGVVMDLGFPGLSWWPLTLVGVGLVLAAVDGLRFRAGAGIGLLAGLAFYLVHVSWSGLYLGPVPWFALSASQAASFAVGCGLIAVASRLAGAGARGAFLLYPLLAAGLWMTREEVASRWPYNGFSWGRVGFSHSEGPLAPLLSWVGTSGLSFVLVAIAAAAFRLTLVTLRSWRARAAAGHAPDDADGPVDDRPNTPAAHAPIPAAHPPVSTAHAPHMVTAQVPDAPTAGTLGARTSDAHAPRAVTAQASGPVAARMPDTMTAHGPDPLTARVDMLTAHDDDMLTERDAPTPSTRSAGASGPRGAGFVHRGRLAAGVRALPLPALAGWAFAVLALALVPIAHVPATGEITVAAVQGNGPAGYFTKKSRGDLLAAQELATAPLLGRDIDVVVWPEDGADIDPLRYAEGQIRIQQLTEALDAPLIFGTITKRDDQYYNSSLAWEPGASAPSDYYDKKRPVPFGEYVPNRAFYAAIVPDLIGLIARDYIPGTREGVLDVSGMRLGSAICFDITADDVISDLPVRGAQVILAQSNNGDFGTTDESVQQLAIARIRAIETGRDVVNVSTVGTSAIIAADGSTIDRLPTFQAGAMVQTVTLRDGLTPATRLRVALPLTVAAASLLTLAALAALAALRARRAS
ncbi:apolipoprotein N-acyltransferase [Catenuloplanes nepalensis]|uniref:Apolipoprotein N-acyltransferase n=1 Tax=Catenuloplanes nepalensis TaxID=587533 RepID=A0ABT9MRJ9_9ACTN|nr:apolipoprotein N-acyltransferase [Catenuloplanes nepalensis]MDP9794062.1 apolipoprotein N-acyltransferase [Catenuloplanes nepalensis]